MGQNTSGYNQNLHSLAKLRLHCSGLPHYLLKDLVSDAKRETILWVPRSYHAEPIQQAVNVTLEFYTGGKQKLDLMIRADLL